MMIVGPGLNSDLRAIKVAHQDVITLPNTSSSLAPASMREDP
jgi:hypothetical protein